MPKKQQELNLPPTPTYQTDPTVTKTIDSLYNYGTQLANQDFSGNLSGLQDAVTVNPDVIKNFFAGLQPYFNQTRQNTINDLAANNQLESSTTANRLVQGDTDLNNLLLGQVAGLQNNANTNRMNLFGTGLNTISEAGSLAMNNQSATNNFNLTNYDNQVAQAIQEWQNANQPKTWELGLSKMMSIADPGGSYMGTYQNPTQTSGASAQSMQGLGQVMQLYSAWKGGGFGGSGKSASTPGASSNVYNWQDSGNNSNFGLLNNQDVNNSLYNYKFN